MEFFKTNCLFSLIFVIDSKIEISLRYIKIAAILKFGLEHNKPPWVECAPTHGGLVHQQNAGAFNLLGFVWQMVIAVDPRSS